MIDFKFKSGFITDRTAIALNKVAAWIDRYESKLKGFSEVPTAERVRVKLTANNGATPPVYSGTEQDFTVAGVPEDKPNGRSFSPSNMPIYERNGKTVPAASITAGYHCWIDRRILVDGVPSYEFDIGASSAASPVFGSFLLDSLTNASPTTATEYTVDSKNVGSAGTYRFSWNIGAVMESTNAGDFLYARIYNGSTLLVTQIIGATFTPLSALFTSFTTGRATCTIDHHRAVSSSLAMSLVVYPVGTGTLSNLSVSPSGNSSIMTYEKLL